MRYGQCAPLARRFRMSMTEVVEESLKADARFRHLTVMPKRQFCKICDGTGWVHNDYWPEYCYCEE